MIYPYMQGLFDRFQNAKREAPNVTREIDEALESHEAARRYIASGRLAPTTIEFLPPSKRPTETPQQKPVSTAFVGDAYNLAYAIRKAHRTADGGGYCRYCECPLCRIAERIMEEYNKR